MGYFDQDVVSGIIDETLANHLQKELRNSIYFNANNLFSLIKEDIYLLNSSKPFNYRKFLPLKFFPVFRVVRAWFVALKNNYKRFFL